jgi:hypothetical protein
MAQYYDLTLAKSGAVHGLLASVANKSTTFMGLASHLLFFVPTK